MDRFVRAREHYLRGAPRRESQQENNLPALTLKKNSPIGLYSLTVNLVTKSASPFRIILDGRHEAILQRDRAAQVSLPMTTRQAPKAMEALPTFFRFRARLVPGSPLEQTPIRRNLSVRYIPKNGDEEWKSLTMSRKMPLEDLIMFVRSPPSPENRTRIRRRQINWLT
jgi:hypothetical protein